MTVSTSASRVPYDGNGVTVSFPVPFPFIQDDYLVVIRTVIATGAETILTLDSPGVDGYSVTGAGGPSGTVITVTAPTALERLTIIRSVPATQESDFVANDPLPSEVIEDSLDKLTMLFGDLAGAEGLSRVPILYSGDIDGSGRYNSNGNRYANAADGVSATDLATVQQITSAGSGSFVQAGTGSVIRTMQDKARETISPEDFGAVGDGVADDVAAFNAAATYVLSLPAGGTITCSPGKKYAFGSTWSVTKTDGKQFMVDMQGCEFTKTAGGWAGPIMYYGNATDIPGYPLVIQNGRFQSVGPNSTGLQLEWAGGSRIDGVVFQNFVNGLSITNTFALLVCNKTQFLDCSTAGIIANTICHNLVVVGCAFFRNQRDVYFIVGAPAYNLSLIGCDMEGVSGALSNAIVLDAGGSAVTVSGCYIESKDGIPVLFGANVEAFKFDGNWLGYNSGTQQWQNILSGSVEGNIFWNQQQTILSSVRDFDIGNNTFAGTSNFIYTPWTAPTFTNGFSNTGGSFANAGYRKDRNGVVWLRGMVQAAGDASAFSLPVGYRPSGIHSFIGLSSAGGVASLGRIQVTAGGSVTVFRTADTTCDLAHVSFTATQ